MRNKIKFSFYILLFILSSQLFLVVLASSHIKITGVGGIKAPDVCYGDTAMPDVVLDPSLSGTVNVDISTNGVPDGTKVKLKFKEEDKIQEEGVIESGKAVVPISLKTGNTKVLYVETEPFISTITKSASNGRLDADLGTVALYHLDYDVIDSSGNKNDFVYYPSSEQINFVEGVNSKSRGIYFWSPLNGYRNNRVHREIPNGSGFTSTPKQWSVEFAVKPLREIGSEQWFPFLVFDQNISLFTFIGKAFWGWGEEGKFSIYHADAKGTWNLIQVENPLKANKWSVVTITHDGHLLKLYINGIEVGSVISDGNRGPHPYGNFGVCAGAIFNSPDWKSNPLLVIDEVRVSNVVRNKEEIANNAKELLGEEYRFRTNVVSASNGLEPLIIKNKTKKPKIRREIRYEVINTTNSQEGELKADKNTVAFFHFNGTTKDSVSKKSLAGDPELVNFDEGRNNSEVSSVAFEGEGDLLFVNKKLFDNNPKEWTIDFFCKPNVEPYFPTGILTIENGQIFASISYAKTFEGKTIISASSLDASSRPVVISAETDFPLDKWTHLALVYRNKKLQFLINGEMVGEANLPSLYKKGDGAINVGSDGGDGVFNGQIDELRISDVARSQAELEVYAKR